MFAIDKKRAERGKFRIAEKYLLLIAALGGTSGAFIGMHLLRHKTKKKKFANGIPILMFIQWLLYVYIEIVYI